MKIYRTAALLLCLAGLPSCQTETDSAEAPDLEPPAAKPNDGCDCPKGGEASQRAKPLSSERYAVTVDDRPTLGAQDALVTLIVFSDYECSYCARFTRTLEQLRERHGEDLRVVFRQLPLPFHEHAPAAARAALAAHRQDAYLGMHNLLFERRRELPHADYAQWAGELGLDRQRFERDLADPALAKLVEEDATMARRFGVRGTPSLFINGRFIVGAQSFERLDEMVRKELTHARRFAAANPNVARRDLYAAMAKDWLTETPSGQRR